MKSIISPPWTIDSSCFPSFFIRSISFFISIFYNLLISTSSIYIDLYLYLCLSNLIFLPESSASYYKTKQADLTFNSWRKVRESIPLQYFSQSTLFLSIDIHILLLLLIEQREEMDSDWWRKYYFRCKTSCPLVPIWYQYRCCLGYL